jgi:hypothetical protein
MSGIIFISGIAAVLSSDAGDDAAFEEMGIGPINAMFTAILQ